MKEYNLLLIFCIVSILQYTNITAVITERNDVTFASSKALVYDFVTIELTNSSTPERERYFGNPGYPSAVEYLIRYDNGSEWHLSLQLNTQLIPDNFQSLHHDSSTGNKVVTNSLIHCFYHGYLRGEEEDYSMAAVSTCDGLQGTLYSNGEFYIIQPINIQTPTKHLVYNVRDEHPTPYSVCGTETQHSHDTLHILEDMKNHKIMRRDTFNKFVELYLTIDNSLYGRISSDFVMSRQYAIDVANQMDMIYKTIGVRVAIVGVQIWNIQDMITVDEDLGITLDNWLQYLPTLKSQTSFTFDNAQLIIGLENLANNVIGKATVGTMCFDTSGGVNRDTSGNNALRIATTVCHEMGHNFGMQHDEGRTCYTACSLGNGCVMNAVSSGQPATQFSQCSVDDLNTNLADGVGFCIFNEPTVLVTDPVCGNGFVETGEECDCGPIATCDTVDPCCIPGECLLIEGAQCATGECCLDCQYSDPTVECRASGNPCDIAEFCSGSDSQCPNNRFKRDGKPCSVSTGDSFCYQGDCKTLTGQCHYLWGTNSSVGDDLCFTNVNTNGNQFGNCGNNGTHYIVCPSDDVKCGAVHCTGISADDFQLSGSVQFFTTTFTSGGQVVAVCESASVFVGNDVPDPGLAFDGTLCDTDSICLSQQCITLQSLNLPTCPSNSGMECSGNGICTNEIACLCDSGFTGSDCNTVESTATSPTTTMTATSPPTTMTATSPPTTMTVSSPTTSGTVTTQTSDNTQPGSTQPTSPAANNATHGTGTGVTPTLGTIVTPVFQNIYFQVGVGAGGGLLLLLIGAVVCLCICCLVVRTRKTGNKKYAYQAQGRLDVLTGPQSAGEVRVPLPSNYPGPPPTPPTAQKPVFAPSTAKKPVLPPNKPKPSMY